MHGEVFTAIAGAGPGCGRPAGRPVRLPCTTGVALAGRWSATGFGYERAAGWCRARWWPACCRRSGTSAGPGLAVDLCSLAAGRLDAYYERGLHDWDFAAGGLIARRGRGPGGRPGREARRAA